MSRAVYSVCFASVEGAITDDIYNVPAGDTAIVSHMTFYCGDDSPGRFGDLALSVALDASLTFIWWLQGRELQRGCYQWSGREVFTGSLILNSILANSSFRASGVLLTPT